MSLNVSQFHSFDEDLKNLSTIPILSPLLQGAENQPFHAFDEVLSDNTELFPADPAQEVDREGSATEPSPSSSIKSAKEGEEMGASNQKSTHTLLQWISSSENQKGLKRMAENCTRELEVFDKNVMEILKEEIEKTIETARRDDMKEIKGLERRLCDLEK